MRMIFGVFVLMLLVPGCQKFLAKPANASDQQARTVADFQAIMDNNALTQNVTPGLGPMYVDDYMVSRTAQSALDVFSIGIYTWQPSLLGTNFLLSWSHPYTAINSCNEVLTELPALTGLDSADESARRFVLGQAYFLRAFAYYQLEETFGQPYRPDSAAFDLGVPLRLSENVLPQTPRATVAAVYGQIVADLGKAVPLLPTVVQTDNPNRACRAAAYALLAKVWLTRMDYGQAATNAGMSLQLCNNLIDYNTIDSTNPHPFPPTGNSEVLFQCTADNYPMQYAGTTLVDSNLYKQYDPDDLRRSIFFLKSSAGYRFKGQYSGLFYLFGGIAVDEVFLVRAESRARIGDLAGAMDDVNTLLAKRWRMGRFTPFMATTQGGALRIVLAEKRKETLFREVRFYDLRRLNQDPAYADTLSRVYGGSTYTLLPGSPRYAFPIPQQEIDLDGEVQNPE